MILLHMCIYFKNLENRTYNFGTFLFFCYESESVSCSIMPHSLQPYGL